MTEYLNTNPHRIVLVTEEEDVRAFPKEHRFREGEKFTATGELADIAENTDGVVRADSDEARAYLASQRVAEVAGTSGPTEAAQGFDPTALDADDAADAIERVTNPDLLRAIRAAEKAGKDRKTVHRAIADRAPALGLAPDTLEAPDGDPQVPTEPGESAPPVSGSEEPPPGEGTVETSDVSEEGGESADAPKSEDSGPGDGSTTAEGEEGESGTAESSDPAAESVGGPSLEPPKSEDATTHEGPNVPPHGEGEGEPAGDAKSGSELPGPGEGTTTTASVPRKRGKK